MTFGSVLQLLVIGCCGGLGACIRFVLDSGTRRIMNSRFPWGLLWVNVSGSLVMGVCVGLTVHEAVHWAPFTIGILGGYTTFSSNSLESVELWRERRRRAAVVNAAGSLVLAVVCALLGMVLGAMLSAPK